MHYDIILQCANHLIDIYILANDYKSASMYCSKMLDLIKQLRGENHADYINQYKKLSKVELKFGNFEAAIRALRQAIDLTKKYLGDKGKLEILFNQLGNCYNLYDIKTNNMLAKELDNKFFQVVGRSSSWSFFWNYNYSLLAKEGIKAYETALSMQRNKYGEANVEVANTLHYLGSIYNNCGNFEKALQYHLEALSIKKKIFGIENLNLLISHELISITYLNKNDLQALNHFSEMIRIIEKTGGNLRKILEVYMKATAYCKDVKNYKMQIHFGKQAIIFIESKFQCSRKSLTNIYKDLADACQSLWRFDEASHCLDESIKLFVAVEPLSINDMFKSSQRILTQLKKTRIYFYFKDNKAICDCSYYYMDIDPDLIKLLNENHLDFLGHNKIHELEQLLLDTPDAIESIKISGCELSEILFIKPEYRDNSIVNYIMDWISYGFMESSKPGQYKESYPLSPGTRVYNINKYHEAKSHSL